MTKQENYTMFFEEFINNGKLVVKRKYTEKYPAFEVGNHAPIREKILSFVNEKEPVSHEDLMEHINGINEETGGTTSRKWVNHNKRYFRITEKDGTKTYALSPLGLRVHRAILNQIS